MVTPPDTCGGAGGGWGPGGCVAGLCGRKRHARCGADCTTTTRPCPCEVHDSVPGCLAAWPALRASTATGRPKCVWGWGGERGPPTRGWPPQQGLVAPPPPAPPVAPPRPGCIELTAPRRGTPPAARGGGGRASGAAGEAHADVNMSASQRCPLQQLDGSPESPAAGVHAGMRPRPGLHAEPAASVPGGDAVPAVELTLGGHAPLGAHDGGALRWAGHMGTSAQQQRP